MTITRLNTDEAVVSAAAHQSGENFHNKYHGITHEYTNKSVNPHNYTKKSGVLYTEIMLPQNAPQEFSDRQTLWNAIEKAEKRWGTKTAREIKIALPRELSLDEHIKLVREYTNDNFISRGMCADVVIHSGHHRDLENIKSKDNMTIYKRNPHAHILLTDRPVNQDGFCSKRNRTLNAGKHNTIVKAAHLADTLKQ